MEKLIPADTVDAKGNVWKTTGENIRNGAKDFSEDDIKAIVDILFPVGSIFFGENAFVLSVGTWDMVSKNVAGTVLVSGDEGTVTGSVTKFERFGVSDGDVTFVRFWKRVK